MNLKKLNHEELSDLSSCVAKAWASLLWLQPLLLGKDSRVELGQEEKEVSRRLNMLVRIEKSMMRQKARVR